MNGAPAPGVARTNLNLSFIERVREACDGHPGGWTIGPSSDEPSPWTRVDRDSATIPPQGWKLHLSANAASAEAVLDRALPVLLNEGAPFKVVKSMTRLLELNDGMAGVSQIGKFITVYPADDEQAVRLAAELDEATNGLPGPAVPSDKPLSPDSLVHYRYGGFEGRFVQVPYGAIVPAIRTPDGSLVPDERGTSYQAPDWAIDPFVEAGLVTEPAERSPLIADRFLTVSTIHASPRGSVHLAVDIDRAEKCILKRARPSVRADSIGRDDGERLRHEAAVLQSLDADPRFPSVLGLVEDNGDLFLAMEDVEGETLEKHVGRITRAGRSIPGGTVADWGRQLAGMLGAVHESGYVYRDLKSPNIIVGPHGCLRLVDFELAHGIGDDGTPHGLGTRGYMSPQQQERDHRSAITDDIFGLGAVLYFAATGAEPSMAPDPARHLDRPVSLMNPGISLELEEVIRQCLAYDPADRYQSMEAVRLALAVIEGREESRPPEFGCEVHSESDVRARARYREMASRLAHTICSVAEAAPARNGVAWRTTHDTATGILSRDVNTGSGGTLLALAELVAALDDEAHRRMLADGARWLAGAPRPEGELVTGLYAGEAGVGAALLRAGQVLGDREFVAAAAERSRLIERQPFTAPDLFVGTAGRLRFHLLLWDETSEPAHLQAAIAAGEHLLGEAEWRNGDKACWMMPDGFIDLSGKAPLGYAHGAAGIADSLLDLFEATADERYLRVAQGVARWLADLAVPTLDDGTGLNWPSIEGL
ncbi:MAG: protein kinase domain-containing protein, partial [Chloroflexota bacterium]